MNKLTSICKTQFRIADSIVTDAGVTIPCIQGQLSEVDVISQNGYRYKGGFWNKVLQNQAIQDRIAHRDMLGMIEHPIDDSSYMKTPYEDASHVVLKAWVDDSGNPWGQFGLLNNVHGNALKALLDVGHAPGVSTRGMGDILQDDVSQYVADENYMLLTWDCVRSPNFATLKMDKVSDSLRNSPVYKELLQAYQLRDSVDDHYNAQRLFAEISGAVQELQSKLNSLKLHLQ